MRAKTQRIAYLQFLVLLLAFEEELFLALEEVLFFALLLLLRVLELLLLFLVLELLELLLRVLVLFLLMLFLALRFSMVLFAPFSYEDPAVFLIPVPSLLFLPAPGGLCKGGARMPLEYFEQRERSLLGSRCEALYAAPEELPARGLTVNGLRCTPERFAELADFALETSPFCGEGFVVRDPAFRPGRHPYHHAGVFYSQEPSARRQRPFWRCGRACGCWTCAPHRGQIQPTGGGAGRAGAAGEQRGDPGRAETLKSNLERMGAANAVVTNAAPAALAAALPGFF